MSDRVGIWFRTDDCMPVDSSDITSYSNKTTEFSVYEQAFAVPHGVTAIATTTTKFGVSTKDIISESQSMLFSKVILMPRLAQYQVERTPSILFHAVC